MQIVEHGNMRKAEKLRRPVLEKQESRGDPQQPEKPPLPSHRDLREIHRESASSCRNASILTHISHAPIGLAGNFGIEQ